MTRANQAAAPAHAPTILLEPQPAHAPTILLDAVSPGVDPVTSVANRLKEKSSVLLGRFKLLEVIGEGGMSLVYKAIDLRKVEAGSADPHIAVKVLTVPFANFSDAISVLSRETHNLQSLSHPNIVRVIDCDRDGDIVFMTMELLAGQSLFEKMKTPKGTALPRELALRVIESIANALDFAHGKNILHGDLKPGNVFITAAGEIKVIDFGLARLMVQPADARPQAPHTAADRMRALTPAYASPEMLDQGDPDPRDDVYSLACVAWKIMTGGHPFKGKDPSAARKAGIQLTRPEQLTAREFRALCHGLEFDRDQRTPSARQFFAEFSAARSVWPWKAAIGATAIALIIALLAVLALKPAGKAVPAATDAPRIASAPTAPTTGTLFRDCPTCPLMKVLPPGDFLQGSAPNEPSVSPFEMPQHEVSIAYAFAIGVYDVTVAEYEEFVAETKVEAHSCSVYDGEWRVNPAVTWKNAVESQTSTHPVSCVSWRDAKDYAAWLSRRTHRSYRLPSAAEWEYAARAGSTAQHPWNDPSAACTYANVADQTAAQRYQGWSVYPCADKFVQSAPVGSFAANAFGLYDMLGNVFAWTDDCWSDDYQGAPSDGSVRKDGDCNQRELRGGSWFSHPDYVRAAYRNRFASDYRSSSIGFRLIRKASL